MTLYREKPRPFRAERITDATFDDPHPNPTHIVGVVYDPITRRVWVSTRAGGQPGQVGNWILERRHGVPPFIMSDEVFREQFEPVDGGWPA